MAKRTFIFQESGNGLYGPFFARGSHTVALRGTFGGATVKLFHRLPDDSDDATATTNANNLPQNPDLQFTAAPVPFILECPESLPLFAEITGGSGSTSLTCALYEIDNF